MAYPSGMRRNVGFSMLYLQKSRSQSHPQPYEQVCIPQSLGKDPNASINAYACPDSSIGAGLFRVIKIPGSTSLSS